MGPLWIQLVNSDWRDPTGGGGADRLDDSEWLQNFTGTNGLDPVPSDGATRTGLANLRRAIRACAERAANDKQPGRAALAEINEVLGQARSTARLVIDADGYRITHAVQDEGLARALYEIAMSFARDLVDQDPSRIRICANPDCRWVFYDNSRSRTRRWCEDSCGNLVRVRSFREKNQE